MNGSVSGMAYIRSVWTVTPASLLLKHINQPKASPTGSGPANSLGMVQNVSSVSILITKTLVFLFVPQLCYSLLLINGLFLFLNPPLRAFLKKDTLPPEICSDHPAKREFSLPSLDSKYSICTASTVCHIVT